jgi:hypothetical protein
MGPVRAAGPCRLLGSRSDPTVSMRWQGGSRRGKCSASGRPGRRRAAGMGSAHCGGDAGGPGRECVCGDGYWGEGGVCGRAGGRGRGGAALCSGSTCTCEVGVA